MFANNSFLKIWSVKDVDGKYYEVDCSTSRKQEDGSYKKDFSSKFVRFYGKAKEKLDAVGTNIPSVVKIINCGETNFYDPEKKREYTTRMVFDYELPTSKSGVTSDVKVTKPAKATKEPETYEEMSDDSELPF